MKKPIVFFASLALILTMCIGMFSGCGKTETNENKEETTQASQQSNTTQITSDEKISYSGVVDSVYTHNGTDYYATKDGFFVAATDKQTKISSMKCTGSFTIIDNVIYYSTVNEIREQKGQNDDDKEYKNWCCCSLYKMNLDGSNNEKVFDVDTGRCILVYIDNNAAYYLSDNTTDQETLYRSIKGYYALYKYDFSTKKAEMIKDYVDYNIITVDNNIFFSTGHSCVGVTVCSISDGGKITSLKEAEGAFVKDLIKLDDSHVLFSVSGEDIDAASYVYDTKAKTVSKYTDSIAVKENEQDRFYSNTAVDGLCLLTVRYNDNSEEYYTFKYNENPVKIASGNYTQITFIDDSSFLCVSPTNEKAILLVKDGQESPYKTVNENPLSLGKNVYSSSDISEYDNILSCKVSAYN